MGCAISNFHHRIIDISKRQNSQAIIVSPHNIYRFLNDNDPNPKCIFIFGGSGSNKGQFIWELMEQSCENYINNKNNDVIKLIINNDDNEIDFSRFPFSYYYVDVEKLIVDNLEKRIEALTEIQPSSYPPSEPEDNNIDEEDIFNEHKNEKNSKMSNDLLDLPDHLVKRKRGRKNSTLDQLKTRLVPYANIITNSWILSLLKKEIEENNTGPYERIFIINLIPNHISIFKDCLFLKQTPTFINFQFNYVAIKLVKNTQKRKEVELLKEKPEGHFDEINNNYIDYFKLINKLFEIQVKNIGEKIRFKLTTGKNAIRIFTKDDLISFIQMPKKDLLELDISEFRFDDYNEILERCRTTSLLFIINNEIDLDDYIKLYLTNEKQYDHVFLRKFIQCYRLTSYSLRLL